MISFVIYLLLGLVVATTIELFNHLEGNAAGIGMITFCLIMILHIQLNKTGGKS